jgi:hypothetical protein
MLPQDRRASVLTYDAALDTLAVKLYRAPDPTRREALRREVASAQATLKRVVGRYSIDPGDLRR